MRNPMLRMIRRHFKTRIGHFNARLFFEQIMAAAEKRGFSPEEMAQLRHNAKSTLREIERDRLRLLGMMRSK